MLMLYNANANAKAKEIYAEKALNLKNFVKFIVTVVTTKLCHERGSAS